MRWPTPEQQQDALARAQLHRRAEIIKKQNEELKAREAAILFPKGQDAIRREMALARANTERKAENAEAERAQRVHEQKVATRLADAPWPTDEATRNSRNLPAAIDVCSETVETPPISAPEREKAPALAPPAAGVGASARVSSGTPAPAESVVGAANPDPMDDPGEGGVDIDRVHRQPSAADDTHADQVVSAADTLGAIPDDLRAALEVLAAQQSGWLTEADHRWCMGCCAQGVRYRRLVVYLPVRVEWPL